MDLSKKMPIWGKGLSRSQNKRQMSFMDCPITPQCPIFIVRSKGPSIKNVGNLEGVGGKSQNHLPIDRSKYLFLTKGRYQKVVKRTTSFMDGPILHFWPTSTALDEYKNNMQIVLTKYI